MIDKKKRIHFVGIGGIGMSGLAEILCRQGHTVSGSDRHANDQTRRLAGLGVTVYEGHDAAHADGDFLVYTSAVHQDNPELAAAMARGIPCIKRAELLGELTRTKRTIAVAGTHGKTTTSAMIARILVLANYDPSLFIGGIMQNMNTNATYTDSLWAVAEADEYDRSFLQLWPFFSVINNIEADHLDCYKDVSDIEKTFAQWTHHTSLFGGVFLSADDPGCARIRPVIRRPVETFGLSTDAAFHADGILQNEQHLSFDVWHQRAKAGRVTLPMSGAHNVRNALAATAVGLSMDIPFATIAEALESFRGTGRRFEILGMAGDIVFVDDYAHHPTEIRATLEGARQGWPDRRIVAVFQPHLFSRTRDFFDDFASAFANADDVWLTDIYPAREEPIPGITGDALFRATAARHARVSYEPTLADLERVLSRQLRKGDLIVTLGAGDITTIGRNLFNRMAGTP